MEFKIIYITSLIVASAAGNPLTSTNASDDVRSDISETTTIVSNISLYSSDVSLRYLDNSPFYIFGKNNGEMLRCFYNQIYSCDVINKAGSPILATVVIGEYIFAGLESGVMWRCSLYTADSCTTFNILGSAINALAVGGPNIYAGVGAGKIWRCKLNQAHSCSTFYEGNTVVVSLAASEIDIYAGLHNGKMLRCSIDGSVNCYVLNTAGSSLTSIAFMGNVLFAGTAAGTMWRCGPIYSNWCQDLNRVDSAITGLSFFNKRIQAILYSGKILSCEMTVSNSCQDVGVIKNIKSIANVYSYSSLQSQYKGENTKCVWQSPAKCPPYVKYYDIVERLRFQVHMKQGKVYNSQGDLFDTSDADPSHSGKAAIFVMEPSGQILISNEHVVYTLHHSSLMAGNPISAAGEINIKQGVITDVTTCSGHYRPSIFLDAQLLESLYLQSYFASVVEVSPCHAKFIY